MRFEDEVWEKVGPEARELLRKASRAHDSVAEEERPKVFTGVLWMTWVMGYFDHKYGPRSFFGYTMPPDRAEVASSSPNSSLEAEGPEPKRVDPLRQGQSRKSRRTHATGARAPNPQG